MTNSIQKQYKELKAKHQDALILFRCGDFYETYFEDAVAASKILGITLTRRINGGTTGSAEMAGFPHHALDIYLPKFVRAGRRVAICDQLEAPKPLVKRGITEIVEPAKITLPKLTKKQYDLLCECIRYRAADNDKERQDAESRGHVTQWYDDLAKELNELKDIIYNRK